MQEMEHFHVSENLISKAEFINDHEEILLAHVIRRNFHKMKPSFSAKELIFQFHGLHTYIIILNLQERCVKTLK